MRRIILLLCITFNLFAQQNPPSVDSLIKVANTNLADSVKIKLYGDISWEVMGSNINLALEYATKELELSLKTNRKADIAQSYSDIGNIYNRKSIYDTALINYNKALELRQALGHEVKMAGIYTNIATVYMRQSKFKEALDINFKSLKLFEKIGDIGKQATVLGNIANLYYELEQNKSAEVFLRKALILAREAKLIVIEGNILVNIGGIKFEEGVQNDELKDAISLDSAAYYFLQAEPLLLKSNAYYNLAVVYNNMGRISVIKKEHKKALMYYEKALEYREALDDKYGTGLSYNNLGFITKLLGQHDKSIEYLNKSAAIFLELKNYINLKQSYGFLAENYEAKKDYVSAMKYFQLYSQYKDSVYNEENAKQMAEMQTKYETDKKDLEIAKNKAEIETKEKQAAFKNLLIAGIIGFTLLLTIAGYLFFRKKQIQQKAELNEEIAKQKELRTKLIIEAEEKERRRIAQDLHDGVGQILSAAKLNLSGLESKITLTTKDEKDAFKNALDLIDDSVKEVRIVSHNMMPNTLIKMGLASAIREFITKIGSVPNLKIDLEIVGLDARLNENTETVLYRVIQEVVNNIIKHAKANTISLQLVKHDKELTIMIEDNGIGFDAENINAFDGIGLKNIISRIEFLNGTVHFDSNPGRGTNVVIEVPA